MVFRIQPDGTSETVWNAADSIAFSMKILKNGTVLVGTGTKGRIYAVGPENSKTLLIQSPEDQTSALLSIGDNLFATSSNLGRLYRVGTQTVAEGTYISTVRDTKFTGRWGMITWRGAGGLQIQTRTGNTENPDLTWSDWSQPYTRAQGEQ